NEPALSLSKGATAPVSRKNFANKTECNRIEAQGKEKQLCLAGGVVTRNSGTSPKNSAYNKLWFEHYLTGYKVENKVIERVTTEMAEKRVEFTNRFVEGLRSKA
ncbi:MAG: hypothetical protein ACUZ8E_06590, partial [Candidatus Anammoxibacter sp.]